MFPALEIARAHVRVLELEAERLRVRGESLATRRRVRMFLKGRSY